MRLCKANSGVNSRNNTSVERKVEVYVQPTSNGRTIKPEHIRVSKMNVYPKLPKGWVFSGQSPTIGAAGAPGYILVTNTKDYFARDRKIGWVTISEAKRTGLINTREYNSRRAQKLENEKIVRKFKNRNN